MSDDNIHKMEDRLRRLNAYHDIFIGNPNGVEMFDHLKALFFHEESAIYREGQNHADVTFLLGQRSVLAYIIKVLNTTKQDITGENRDRKANDGSE